MENEKIGDGLLRIGAITQEQLDDILKRQKDGDKRLFGEIAIDLSYVNDQAVDEYLKAKK